MSLDFFTFNTTLVLLGTAMLGLACGAVGTFAVLRRRALVGDVIAHASLPGICLAYLLVGHKSLPLLMLGAFFCGLLSVFTISTIKNYTRLKEDAALAITLSSFFGLGIMLSRMIQGTPQGNQAGLDDFIFGKAASMVQDDVTMIGISACISLIVVAVLGKELKLLCFDPEFARCIGYPTRILDMVLMILIALCTVTGLPAVGVVLVSALLILPAASARLWTNNVDVMAFLASLFGCTSALAGTLLSAFVSFDGNSSFLPTGPMIVICCSLTFFVSALFSPLRGCLRVLRKAKEGAE